jgi:hypothetical protein
LSELSVFHLLIRGGIENSENDGSWGIVKGGVILDEVLLESKVGSGSGVEFLFHQGFFGEFLRFLNEIDEIIGFVGGSSESFKGNIFNFFLSGHD